MAIRRIEQVSCSLNLGLIYSVDYSYSPDSGVSIKIYFVNESGDYSEPNLLPMRKAYIRIGPSSFTMYAVKSGIEYGPGRRVAWVEFVDEFFQLSNYYVVWPGRGSGTNVVQLGKPVDNRSLSAKRTSSLDVIATEIESFTKFPDYVHSFNDFLAVLRTKFNVQVSAMFDSSITRDFQGSFQGVLQDWCNYYNLSFFFENSVIKIFDPVALTITLPSRPADAISYSIEQDVTTTYGKTVSNWFEQEGGQYSLSQTSDLNNGGNLGGPTYVRTDTLYPVGYEYGLEQPSIDLSQSVAAQYGQDFWFLYNYWQGTTAQNCGWTPRPDLDSLQTAGTVLEAHVAIVNAVEQEAKFTAFQEYGSKIAGRWYLSNRKNDVSIDAQYTWFSEANEPIQNYVEASNKILDIQTLPNNDASLTNKTIGETVINQYYPGVNYIGSRLAYYDPTPVPTGSFVLGDLQGEVNNLAQKLSEIAGNVAYDYQSQLATASTGANQTFTSYFNISFSEALQSKFQQVSQETSLLKPRYTSIPIRGISTRDYSSAKAAAQESDNVDVIRTNQGPSVIGNTSVIKTLQQGSYIVYYDKYSKCASASTPNSYFGFRFEPQQVSSDNPVAVTFRKLANNTYELNRDYSFIDQLVQNPLLSTLAQARSFPTRRVSYTVNYFKDIPANFLTQGLVGLSVSITDNGVQSSYTFSNEVLRVPDRSSEFAKLAQEMRNSWISRYQPETVIS